MEDNILDSTKKVLGLDKAYTPFDLDIMTHINAALAVVNQLGVGPTEGFFLVDGSEGWSDTTIPDTQLSIVKTYVYLKVRLLFDPPQTSFVLESLNKQIAEYEWRLNTLREVG